MLESRRLDNLTDFQQVVLETANAGLNRMACCWTIAQVGFPEKWRKRAARGALIGHIRRAGYRLQDAGLCVVLPPKKQFDTWIIAIR